MSQCSWLADETDLCVDRMNLDDTETRLKDLHPGPLRFAIDTVGAETASWCQSILASRTTSYYASTDAVPAPGTPVQGPPSSADCSKLSHLVTLTGSPRTTCRQVQTHQVPIKLFHAHKKIGGLLSGWLHELLDRGTLRLPEVEFVDGGLGAVNDALERLKDGSVSGRRLIVKTK